MCCVIGTYCLKTLPNPVGLCFLVTLDCICQRNVVSCCVSTLLKPNTKIRLKHSWVIYIIVTSCGATPKLNWLTETPLACFSEIKVHLQNSSCPKTVFQVIHSDFPFSKTSQKRSQRIAKISFPPCFCSVNINVFSW